MEISKIKINKLLREAYARGFAASGEGYNQEYPFDQHATNPESDTDWKANRDKSLANMLLTCRNPELKIRGEV